MPEHELTSQLKIYSKIRYNSKKTTFLCIELSQNQPYIYVCDQLACQLGNLPLEDEKLPPRTPTDFLFVLASNEARAHREEPLSRAHRKEPLSSVHHHYSGSIEQVSNREIHGHRRAAIHGIARRIGGAEAILVGLPALLGVNHREAPKKTKATPLATCPLLTVAISGNQWAGALYFLT